MQTFPLHPAVQARLERVGREFLVDILRADLRNRPTNLQALAELAHNLTRLGRVEEGLDVDRSLARLAPADPLIHYNLACSLALLSRPDEALDELERAVALGYADGEHLVVDPDLRALHPEERFRALVRRLGAELADFSSR